MFLLIQLLKSEEDASYKPAKKACVQLVDNLVEHILKYEESLAGTYSAVIMCFHKATYKVLFSGMLFLIINPYHLCREQGCKLNTTSGVHHHLVLIQQDKGAANGQTCYDHATVPDN